MDTPKPKRPPDILTDRLLALVEQAARWDAEDAAQAQKPA